MGKAETPRQQKARTARQVDRDLAQKRREKLQEMRAQAKALRAELLQKRRESSARCRIAYKRFVTRSKRARERLKESIERSRRAAKSICAMRKVEHLDSIQKLHDLKDRLEKERHEQHILKVWTPSRKSIPRLARTKASQEAREESDSLVAKEIDDPSHLIVWDKVKHKVHATSRKSRIEAFYEWMRDHSASVYEILEADAIAHLERLEYEQRRAG